MAKAIGALAAAGHPVQISGVISRGRPDWAGAVPIALSLDELDTLPDVLIDFSLPEGTELAAAWCGRHRVPLLSGVTGLPPAAHAALSLTAEASPVLWSANFSIGVNLLAQFCGRVAAVAGPGATVQIEDIHHQWKKDAPSGTALMLGESIRAQWPTGPVDIDYQSRREGEVIGEHRVRFELAGETVILSHAALEREVFARGALAAAAWLARQPAGLYTAADWLAA
jgi:4-hydroxy-tetrahydrodipicolinate reductase